MMERNPHSFFLVALAVVVCTGVATASAYLLPSVTINSGGKALATPDSDYVWRLSVGQPVASKTLGVQDGFPYRAVLGFWHLPYGPPPLAIEEETIGNKAALGFGLADIHPNPFARSTVVSYSVPSQTYVHLRVVDITGRAVCDLVNGQQKPGHYRVTWDVSGVQGARMPKGIYFCQLTAGDFAATRKMVKVD